MGLWVQKVWSKLFVNVEGEGGYTGWGLWHDGSRGSSAEGGQNTGRRVATVRNGSNERDDGRLT